MTRGEQATTGRRSLCLRGIGLQEQGKRDQVMNKREISALESVYGAEIQNRLPFQSRARIYKALEAKGMVERYTRTFGKGPFGVRVEGWSLTHLGRLEYCATCKEVQDDV